MKSKIEQYKAELAELMETKNDPDTPKDIKDAIEPAIKKLNLLITGLGVKNLQSKVSKSPATSKKESKAPSTAKKSSDASLERCKEILAKYNDKKKTDAKRVEKRKRAGKPVELTPSETIKKAAKSVKTKVVEMDKGLKVSEEASIIRGILDSVVSAMSGIKDSVRKKMFIGKIIEGLRKLEKGVRLKTAEHGMYLHEINGEFENDNAEMLRLNIVEIRHHADEIMQSLNAGSEVEAWVLSRSERAKTDMSDIAHYLDSSLKVDSMADGGMMAKGGVVMLESVGVYYRPSDLATSVDGKFEESEIFYLNEIDNYEWWRALSKEDKKTIEKDFDVDKFLLKEFDTTDLDAYHKESVEFWEKNKKAKGGYMADGGYMAKGGVIASSTSKEGIEKLIGDYYYSKNISIQKIDNKDEYEVSNSKGKIDGVKVVVKKGRYQFVNSDKMDFGGMMAKGGEIADIDKMKKSLIAKAKSKGIYEDFGQKEVRELEDKYGYTAAVQNFDNWAMNFDLSQMADGGMTAGRGRLLSALKRDRAYTSKQEWEKNYKRKGSPKKPKYNTSYAVGGQAKVKQYPDLSNTKPTVIN